MLTAEWTEVGNGVSLRHRGLTSGDRVDFHVLERADRLGIKIEHPENYRIPTDVCEACYCLMGENGGDAELDTQIDHLEFYQNGYVSVVCHGVQAGTANDADAVWLQARMVLRSPYGASLSLSKTRASPYWGMTLAEQEAVLGKAISAMAT